VAGAGSGVSSVAAVLTEEGRVGEEGADIPEAVGEVGGELSTTYTGFLPSDLIRNKGTSESAVGGKKHTSTCSRLTLVGYDTPYISWNLPVVTCRNTVSSSPNHHHFATAEAQNAQSHFGNPFDSRDDFTNNSWLFPAAESQCPIKTLKIFRVLDFEGEDVIDQDLRFELANPDGIEGDGEERRIQLQHKCSDSNLTRKIVA